MNPSPRLHGQFITPQTCGVQAMCNSEDAFWQSRMTLAGRRAELPNLVSLHSLARKIRATACHVGPTIADLIAADFIPGIPARALTPTGSFDSAVGRSTVAAAHQTGRRVYPNGGHRFIESACGYAEAKAAETDCPYAHTATGPNFGTNPVTK